MVHGLGNDLTVVNLKIITCRESQFAGQRRQDRLKKRVDGFDVEVFVVVNEFTQCPRGPALDLVVRDAGQQFFELFNKIAVGFAVSQIP